MAEVLAEDWRPVVGFEGRYEVSSLGRVASLPTKTWPTRRILKAAAHKRGGYLYVTLRRQGTQFHRKVHLLVCEAFNGSRPVGTEARHLDGNRLNNNPGNLAWGTRSENNLDQVRHGTHPSASKTHCHEGHQLSGANLYINATSGARQCRACQRRAKAKYEQKRRL